MNPETMTNEELAEHIEMNPLFSASKTLLEVARRLRTTPETLSTNTNTIARIYNQRQLDAVTRIKAIAAKAFLNEIVSIDEMDLRDVLSLIATPASISQGHNELPKEVMQSGQENGRTLRSRSDMPGVEPEVPSPGSITIGQGAGTEWAVEAAKEICEDYFHKFNEDLGIVSKVILRHCPHPLAGGELREAFVAAVEDIESMVRFMDSQDGCCGAPAWAHRMLADARAALTKGPASP